MLIHERTNPRDTNSVRVDRQSGERLGYLKSHLAHKLVGDMAMGKEIQCRIAEFEGPEFCRTVNVAITVLGEATKGAETFAARPYPKTDPERFAWVFASFFLVIMLVVWLWVIYRRHSAA